MTIGQVHIVPTTSNRFLPTEHNLDVLLCFLLTVPASPWCLFRLSLISHWHVVCPGTQVRTLMVSRMAKPEEVLVVENDQGEVVREFMKDTDSINLYKNMRETLGECLAQDSLNISHTRPFSSL